MHASDYMSALQVYVLLLTSLCKAGANGLLLTSSVESEGGQVFVCPNTNITFTCSDTQIFSFLWYARPLLNEDNTPGGLSIRRDPGYSIVVDDIFNLTVESVENITGLRGDLTSTLNIMVVNDQIQDETTVMCISNSGMTYIIMLRKDPPIRPSGFTVETHDFQSENFSILLSWEVQRTDDIYYIVTVNTTLIFTTHNMSLLPILLEGIYYNIPVNVSLTAINCAGPSASVTEYVYESGCSPPSPPVNGSVSEFTSSRVGAQVTYSCDSDLVLVGERVATCSQSELQWIPSRDTVSCVQPTKTDSSSSIPVGVIVAPIVFVLIGAVGTTIIALGIVLCRHKANLRKKPQRVDHNSYDDHELLPRPGNSTSNTAISSLHSPISASRGDTVTNTAAVVTIESSPATQRNEVISSPTTGLITIDDTDTNKPLENSHTPHNVMQYVEVSFERTVPKLTPLNLNEPVQYSKLRVSNSCSQSQRNIQEHCSQPSPPAPSDTLANLPAVSDKHHLDEQINIDKVIQQLQELTSHWWAFGEAANIPPSVLEEIADHFKGNEHDSFAEVISRLFIPGHTTWFSIARICEHTGFDNVADALLGAYNTNILPVHIDEEDTLIQSPPTKSAPPIPHRGSPLEDLEYRPPFLPPPLAPEDVPSELQSSGLPELPPASNDTPPLPPKLHST